MLMKHVKRKMLKNYLMLFLTLISVLEMNSQNAKNQLISFNSNIMSDGLCPIEIVKSAVKSNSIELLKTAYSNRMITLLSDKEEWETLLQYWTKLGLDNFSCKIDTKKSHSNFFYRGNNIDGGMAVVKEESSWKFDER